MHTGHHQRLFCSQRREQAGQPLGQHGLSGARWTHHQQVVAASGGYLKRIAAEFESYFSGDFEKTRVRY
jgi:hypothetical protein